MNPKGIELGWESYHAAAVAEVEALVEHLTKGVTYETNRNAVFGGNKEATIWRNFKSGRSLALEPKSKKALIDALRSRDWQDYGQSKSDVLTKIEHLLDICYNESHLKRELDQAGSSYKGRVWSLWSNEDYIGAISKIREELDFLRRAGEHERTFLYAKTAVAHLRKKLAIRKEERLISDFSSFLLLPAAYGFFQSDNLGGQLIALRELDLICQVYGKTHNTLFVANTMRHQLITSEIRRLEPFDARYPQMKYEKGTEHAKNAFSAYIEGNSGIVKDIDRNAKDIGAGCNAGLEAVFTAANMADRIPGIWKSPKMLLEREFQESRDKGNHEFAARILLCLVEACISQKTEVRKMDSRIEDAHKLINKVHGKTSLLAKAAFVESRLEGEIYGRIGCAQSRAEVSAEYYLQFGAAIRAKEARSLQNLWEK